MQIMVNKNTKSLLAYDFIGKEICVIASDCKSLVGRQGAIVDETKNMFIVESEKKQIKLFKAQITFRIKGSDVEIDGKKIVKTPDERLKANI